jgi:mannosyltransferase
MSEVASTSATDVAEAVARLRSDAPEARIGRVHASFLALEIVFVSGLALVLGLIRLGTPSLWVDEAATADAVHWSVVDLFDGYHGLFYSIEKPWTAVAGTSEWALRFPAVVGSMLACALLVVLAHRLFRPPVPVLSGALLAANPFVVKWSQQARGYTFLLVVTLLATIALLRALERGTRSAWALYGLAFSAVLMWHPVAGIVLVAPHAVLVAQRRERVMPHGLLAAVLICAIGVPWVAQIALRSTGEEAASNWLGAPTAATVFRTVADISGVAGLGVLLGAVGLWVLYRGGRTDRAVWLGTWAFAPFVVALGITVLKPVFLDRYLIVAAPAFALLVAIALVRLPPRLALVAGGVAVVATCFALVSWYRVPGDGNWRSENWRSAVRWVLERRSESDVVLVAPWSARPSAEYYGANVVDVSRAPSIWVLTWSESGDDITAAERTALGFGDHRLVERTQFGRRVTAQLWQRGG